MRPIPSALASYGMSGSVFHAPLLHAHPHFSLCKILERSERGSRMRYPDVALVRQFEELCRDPGIELIVVNTPDATHYPLCRQALEAGKHVVVEKPFTLTGAEAEDLIELARKQGVILTVFQNRRWDGDFLTVKKVIAGGLLGRLVAFESYFDRYRNFIQPATWKEVRNTGAEILYNLGSHLIDQACVLFGMPQAVFADMGIQRSGGQVDDFFNLRLRYDELSVILCASYLVREPGPRFILHGTEGSFLKWGMDPQEEELKAGAAPGAAGWGEGERGNWGKLNTSTGGLHVHGFIETIPGNYPAFYDGLAAAIRKGKSPPVDPLDSLQVIRLIEAAIRSNSVRAEVPVA